MKFAYNRNQVRYRMLVLKWLNAINSYVTSQIFFVNLSLNLKFICVGINHPPWSISFLVSRPLNFFLTISYLTAKKIVLHFLTWRKCLAVLFLSRVTTFLISLLAPPPFLSLSFHISCFCSSLSVFTLNCFLRNVFTL